jgi:hypothetical protein
MGQMMLVIFAFTMLSILALSVNATMIGSVATGLEAQAQLNALSLGQSLLDEILSKEYDENTTGGKRVFSASGFTAVATLGPDAGEALPVVDSTSQLTIDSTLQSKLLFDDIDDYHNYYRAVYDSVLGWFDIKSTITYASETYPDSSLTTRTHFKVVTVTVEHPNLPKREVEGEMVMIPVVLKDIAIYRRYF